MSILTIKQNSNSLAYPQNLCSFWDIPVQNGRYGSLMIRTRQIVTVSLVLAKKIMVFGNESGFEVCGS